MKRLFLILALLAGMAVASRAASIEAIYSVESPLVAETLADVAYRVTDAAGLPVKGAMGQLVDEKGDVAVTFETDESGQGLFIFKPKMGRYTVQWSVDGKDFTTDFLPVKKDGYAWSVDNTTSATYIPFDADHPYWSPAHHGIYYSALELEQLSKMKHRFVIQSKRDLGFLMDSIESNSYSYSPKPVEIIAGKSWPIIWSNVRPLYSSEPPFETRRQGKDKPDASEFSWPQDVTEHMRVWVERPKSMTGSTLRIAVYHGDTKLDEDVLDLSGSSTAFISFPLRIMPQGDVEVRLYDSDGQLLGTRDIKVTHYMHKKQYVDVRKTDLDLRLRRGIAYPLISSKDWKRSKNTGLRMYFAPEGGSLIAGVRSQVAFSAMNDSGEEVAVNGEVYSSKDSLQTAFASWSPRGGSFFLTPEKGESYYAIVNYGGKKYKAALPEVAEEGRMLGVDCLTLLDSGENSEEAIDELLDRLNYWDAFWLDGETRTRDKADLKREVDRMLSVRSRQDMFWDGHALKAATSENKLVGKYALKNFVVQRIPGGYNIDYPDRYYPEDDIKIRLVNNNVVNDSLEIRLTDDKGKICDKQRIITKKTEVWLRFPIDENTPEGYLNIVVANPAGEKLCRRRIHVAHYSRGRDYRTARERDIRNILGVRRYAPAAAIGRL